MEFADPLDKTLYYTLAMPLGGTSWVNFQFCLDTGFKAINIYRI